MHIFTHENLMWMLDSIIVAVTASLVTLFFTKIKTVIKSPIRFIRYIKYKLLKIERVKLWYIEYKLFRNKPTSVSDDKFLRNVPENKLTKRQKKLLKDNEKRIADFLRKPIVTDMIESFRDIYDLDKIK